MRYFFHAIRIVVIASALAGCSQPNTSGRQPTLPPLSESAQKVRYATVQQSLEQQESGLPLAWNSPDGLSHGVVTPLGTTRSALYGWCRDYEERIETGGHVYPLVGVACRESGPDWLVLDVRPVTTG